MPVLYLPRSSSSRIFKACGVSDLSKLRALSVPRGEREREREERESSEWKLSKSHRKKERQRRERERGERRENVRE